jgi:hypothetical protein
MRTSRITRELNYRSLSDIHEQCLPHVLYVAEKTSFYIWNTKNLWALSCKCFSDLYRSMETNSRHLYFVDAEILFTYESYMTEVWVLGTELTHCRWNLSRNKKKSNNSSRYLFLEIGIKNDVHKLLTGLSSSKGTSADLFLRFIHHTNPLHILHLFL